MAPWQLLFYTHVVKRERGGVNVPRDVCILGSACGPVIETDILVPLLFRLVGITRFFGVVGRGLCFYNTAALTSQGKPGHTTLATLRR